MQALLDRLVYSKAWSYRLTRHLLFWLLYFRLFQWMMEIAPARTAWLWALLFLPVNALFVYFIVYRLVPRYLMRFAYWPFFWGYCLSLITCLTVDFYLGYKIIYPLFPPLPFNNPTSPWQALATIFDPVQFSVVNVMAGIAVFIKIYKFWRAELWLKWQAAQEKARAELELLKAQLQPQFLKNTLRHLHDLMNAGSDKAPQLLMRLSAILSYILYECREADVLVEREIEICREYIALESERHGHWLEVSVDVFGSFPGKRIAPLVLLPLIGYAFPDQPGRNEPGWMAFDFSIEGDQLLLRVVDGTGGAAKMRPVHDEGPGIEGYLDRLHLVYGSRVTFTRKEREEDEIISLTIELGQLAPGIVAAPEPNASLFRYAVFDY